MPRRGQLLVNCCSARVTLESFDKLQIMILLQYASHPEASFWSTAAARGRPWQSFGKPQTMIFASRRPAFHQLLQREEDLGKLLANSRPRYCSSMPPRCQLLVNGCSARGTLANFWQTQDDDIAVACLREASCWSTVAG